MDAKFLLFVGLGLFLLIYAVFVFRAGFVMPTAFQTAIGFVTAFFDTLGIGSFATTTSVYKLRNMVPVKLIPGTLNVGHTLATIAQAFGARRSIQSHVVMGWPVTGSVPNDAQYPSRLFFSLGIDPSTTRMNGCSDVPSAASRNGRRKSSPTS